MQKIQSLFNVGILLVLAKLTAGEDTEVGDVGLYTAGVKRGGNIQLFCDVESNKTLKALRWTRQDKASSPRKTIAKLTFKAGATNRSLPYQEQYNLNNDSYTLMVSNMNSSMEGYYTCYANNIVRNEYHIYMTDSCTVNNCKKSVKKGKLFLELSTPSDNLPKYFGSLKVIGECNGITKEICHIDLVNSSNTNCEFMGGQSSRYLIIVTNGEKYQLCNVYITLTKSSACFTSEAWNFTIKAEDE
ncbi:---NA---, partial [Paramuricea clavata]